MSGSECEYTVLEFENVLMGLEIKHENTITDISSASEATVTVLAGGKANATGRGLSDISPKTRRP